ncbi:uncharacterized protein Z519_06258 [Cladophialophora bantiana CBS 173.52]|uniref:Xylanolytic transcriptional activator regulatory domain-containing protein n=1 Tax=Cladophialophora bantiana (strain ATCC 10958 / CBS 173.52 / CDC B-1940 / NIH 8579) TaxID=1442370 RepID=A0A0D2HK45_CLAB1|nr:uncharacterized protein Z519_06258 [Cladophialophora bantiana CBS 173.52]KIW93653.1 hypothetical protein Z519_06258 [Cladophialophora bantiana CBS 173.52]
MTSKQASKPSAKSNIIQSPKFQVAQDRRVVNQVSNASELSLLSNFNGEPGIVPEPRPSMGLHLADFSVDVSDLEKMRTFPSSVPLPDLDGDLEFLDFFDPFLGLPPKQLEAFAIPPLGGNTDGWSPLENFSGSSQASMQDYGFQQNQLSTAHETPSVDDSNQSWETASHANSRSKECPISWDETSAQVFTTPRVDIEGPSSFQVPQSRYPKPPGLSFTESMRAHLLKDLSNRLAPEQLISFRLPSAAALQKCIRTYIDAFHVHLPIFHLQTMDFETTPSPLILAICATGALYRLERKIAASLYLKADQALAAAVLDRGEHLHKKPRLLEEWVQPRPQSPKSTPEALWKGQTRLLLAMLSCFSGDTEVISKAITRLGDFLVDFRELAPTVKPRKSGGEWLTWRAWIERESVKRLLYGQIAFGNLVTMTYGIPPGYSVVSDGFIEMPCDQSLWDALTEEQWHEAAMRKGQCSSLNVKQAISMVMNGNSTKTVPQECWEWSPFAISVVINVISIHIWHITQGSYFFGEFSSPGQSNETQKSQTLAQTEAALSRCRALITQASSDADYPWTEAETPLFFNCLALLRVSYCRAFTGHSAADSMMLLKESQEEFIASIEDFIALPQNRGNLVARAVSRAFEGMLIPYKAGTMLIKKTAALTWAVGHALAGWEVALLVTKWVHAIEVETRPSGGGSISELETQTMQAIRNLLSELEDGFDVEGGSSLAAKLARYWAGFYDDTWVWGLTPRMGYILRELANCYESKLAAS